MRASPRVASTTRVPMPVAPGRGTTRMSRARTGCGAATARVRHQLRVGAAYLRSEIESLARRARLELPPAERPAVAEHAPDPAAELGLTKPRARDPRSHRAGENQPPDR